MGKRGQRRYFKAADTDVLHLIQTHPIRDESQFTPRLLIFSLEGAFCGRHGASPLELARRQKSGAIPQNKIMLAA